MFEPVGVAPQSQSQGTEIQLLKMVIFSIVMLKFTRGSSSLCHNLTHTLHGAGIFASIGTKNHPNVGKYTIHEYLVGDLEHFLFSHIFGIIIPVD